MNLEQVKGTLRNVVSLVCGYLVGKGYVSQDMATMIVGAVVAIGPIVWTYLNNTKSAAIAVVNDMTEVAGVITKDTPAGVALANSVPSSTVAPVGSAQATNVAKNGGK